jgi:Animal haem peroxidase
VEHHGAESYYVLGEGLLTESGGGRPRPLAAAVEAATPPFRFSRMGPSGKGSQLGDTTRQKLAAAMTAGAKDPNGRIPAGFTYLGQFIDHDLTADKTNVMLGTDVSPDRMLQGRSPVLDLDSLYGAGPGDPVSAQFYSDGLRLKMGTAIQPLLPNFDLPRVGKGSTKAARRVAQIPELRNDENLVVAQTHLAFIRFHNRVCDTLPKSTPPGQLFSRARRKVTKHYQWMVKTDFLPRIVDKAIVNDVFTHGRKIFEVGATPTDMPTMPLEFSVAAYRLGHSMVRQAYNWNVNFDDGAGTLDLLFQFSATGGDLGGALHLLQIWVADFRRLYNFGEAGREDLVVPPAKFNRAQRIDTKLVNPLADLPQGAIGGAPVPDGSEQRNLAYRNLTRANMVALATGQQMAAFIGSKGVAVTPLTKAQIRDGKGGATLDGLTKKQRQRVVEDTPLWFYVLREAELNGGRLTGVGGRIVAETFHRAMEGATFSIVRDPEWRPQLGPDANTFRMVDLLLFAANGKANILNPLGG